MKCISFESFWRQLNKLSSSDHEEADFEATARKYLNINPEGELLRETHDIIEELRMMSHIFAEQHHVVEQFTSHLQNLREKEEKGKDEHSNETKMLEVMTAVRKLLEERFKKEDNQEGDMSSQTEALAGSGKLTVDGSAGHGHNHPTKDRAGKEERILPNGTRVNTESTQSATNKMTLDETKLGSPDGIPAALGAADASCQPTISIAKISIPESTIQFAQDVGREISSRRTELQKLEQSTVYVSEQVPLPQQSTRTQAYQFITAQRSPRSETATSEHHRG